MHGLTATRRPHRDAVESGRRSPGPPPQSAPQSANSTRAARYRGDPACESCGDAVEAERDRGATRPPRVARSSLVKPFRNLPRMGVLMLAAESASSQSWGNGAILVTPLGDGALPKDGHSGCPSRG